MPPRRGLKSSACDHLAAGGTWPEGPLTEDALDEARFALEVGQRLIAHCDANGVSINVVSRAPTFTRKTVINLLAGRTWGDLPSSTGWRLGLGSGCGWTATFPDNPRDTTQP